MKETDRITALKGVGEKTAAAFRHMGVETVGDLLASLPLRYETYGAPLDIGGLQPGQTGAVRAVITGTPVLKRGRLPVLRVSAEDEEGARFELVWFHMPYLRNQLHKGDRRIFRGRLNRSRYGLTLEQAALFTEEEYGRLSGSLQPVYGTVTGLTAGRIRKTVAEAFAQLEETEDFLPEDVRQRYDLWERSRALRMMHFPENEALLLQGRRRMVFEEFLLFILAVRQLRDSRGSCRPAYVLGESESQKKLLAGLPYDLTDAQKRVLAEVNRDLSGGGLMNRLIQGDVGSGKTIIAFLAMLKARDSGCQSALMAPTEVLARQHFEKLSALSRDCGLGLRIELLTGSMTAREKREAYGRIEAHAADLIIGTHALIQKGVTYDRLALVITDEQHRFGVKQRETLSLKGGVPHILVMSATPIPRTLAMIVYGDMDVSVIDQLPAGRRPIKNCVVDISWRPKAYEFIRSQLREGRQAYVICPKVEPEGDYDGENVLDYTERLREALPPGITVEYLHGKLRPAEKNARMERFLSGEIQVLVSTTVIEVGVDVPNASVMMIENADRFGLAQLHQLRGRVGRGAHQSYCIFVNGSGDREKQERLEILNRSNDGFRIAEEDLKLRGPGDVFGIRQSGALQFAVGDIFTDSGLLAEAAACAGYIMDGERDVSLLRKRLAEYSTGRLERLSL